MTLAHKYLLWCNLNEWEMGRVVGGQGSTATLTPLRQPTNFLNDKTNFTTPHNQRRHLFLEMGLRPLVFMLEGATGSQRTDLFCDFHSLFPSYN
jgi:hypothetical protein